MDQDYECRLLRQINIQNENASPIVSQRMYTHFTCQPHWSRLALFPVVTIVFLLLTVSSFILLLITFLYFIIILEISKTYGMQIPQSSTHRSCQLADDLIWVERVLHSLFLKELAVQQAGLFYSTVSRERGDNRTSAAKWLGFCERSLLLLTPQTSAPSAC